MKSEEKDAQNEDKGVVILENSSITLSTNLNPRKPVQPVSTDTVGFCDIMKLYMGTSHPAGTRVSVKLIFLTYKTTKVHLTHILKPEKQHTNLSTNSNMSSSETCCMLSYCVLRVNKHGFLKSRNFGLLDKEEQSLHNEEKP